MTKSHLRRPLVLITSPSVKRTSEYEWNSILNGLVDGVSFVLDQPASIGLRLLSCLETAIGKPSPTSPFETRKVFQRDYRRATMNLWVEIQSGTSSIGGFEIPELFHTLYPNTSSGWIRFVELQTLIGADKRYREGIHYPVLGHRLHPFFEVYAPKRTEHLQLFATWLHQYRGCTSNAIDVGTGSGILTYLLAKSGIESIVATDQNPNAVYSLEQELLRHPLTANIQCLHTDLLNGVESSPLIVFNPPWIPGDTVGSVDEALFFTGGLFERFFNQATRIITPSGRVVLIFSNILTLVRPDIPHPIELELARGRFTLINKMTRRIKPPKGSKRRTKERVEVWELQLKS